MRARLVQTDGQQRDEHTHCVREFVACLCQPRHDQRRPVFDGHCLIDVVGGRLGIGQLLVRLRSQRRSDVGDHDLGMDFLLDGAWHLACESLQMQPVLEGFEQRGGILPVNFPYERS